VRPERFDGDSHALFVEAPEKFDRVKGEKAKAINGGDFALQCLFRDWLLYFPG
jgi:hypothetical protein